MKQSYKQIIQEFTKKDFQVAFDPVKSKYAELVTTRLMDISAEGVMVFHSTAVTTSKVPYWVQHVVIVDWFTAIGMVDLNYSERANLAIFGDLLLRCNDPSYLYHGFAFILSQLDSNAYSNPSGTEKYPDYDGNTGVEDRYPIIRNPDLEGIVCKHLIRVLTQLPYMISSVAKAMKIYVEQGIIDVDEELVPEEIVPIEEIPTEEVPEEDQSHVQGHFGNEE